VASRWLRNRAFVSGTLGAALVVLAGLTSLVYTPHDPEAVEIQLRLKGPGAAFTLGTDQFGRDVLSRLGVGASIALVVAGGTGGGDRLVLPVAGWTRVTVWFPALATQTDPRPTAIASGFGPTGNSSTISSETGSIRPTERGSIRGRPPRPPPPPVRKTAARAAPAATITTKAPVGPPIWTREPPHVHPHRRRRAMA